MLWLFEADSIKKVESLNIRHGLDENGKEVSCIASEPHKCQNSWVS